MENMVVRILTRKLLGEDLSRFLQRVNVFAGEYKHGKY